MKFPTRVILKQFKKNTNYPSKPVLNREEKKSTYALINQLAELFYQSQIDLRNSVHSNEK